MTYVSFVEIFNKSQLSFLDAGHSERDAYLYATLCFFGGVVTMLVSFWSVILPKSFLCPARIAWAMAHRTSVRSCLSTI